MFGINKTKEEIAAEEAARAAAEANQARTAEEVKTEAAIRAEAIAANAEQEALALKRKALEVEETVSLRIRGMRSGETMQYATAGLHLAREHRYLLPKVIKEDSLGRAREQVKRKMVPGVIYDLPKSVADIYLKASPEFLEVVA